MIDERGGKDVDLDYSVSEFDASTCLGDHFYDIFENKVEVISDGSIVWVNNDKTICEGRVIEIYFSDLPEYAKHLKFIWMNTKNEDRVLIRKCSK